MSIVLHRLRRGVWVLLIGGLLGVSAPPAHADDDDPQDVAIAAGLKLEEEDEYAQALEQYEKAFRLAKSADEPDQVRLAYLNYQIGRMHENLEDNAAAEKSYLAAHAGYKESLGADNVDVGRVAYALGNVYSNTSKYEEAEKFYREALAIREKKLEKNDINIANVYDGLGSVMRNTSRSGDAISFYGQSLKIAEAHYGKDAIEIAEYVDNVGHSAYDLSNFAKAEALYRRALAIREAKLGLDHEAVAESLNDVGLSLQYKGELAKAESMLARALKIHEAKDKSSLDVARAAYNLADLYHDMGQYPKAESLYDRSLAIREGQEERDDLLIADSLFGRARLYHTIGQFAKAEELHLRSLKLLEDKNGQDDASIIYALNNLSVLYRVMGQFPKAKETAERAIRISTEKHGESALDTAQASAVLADLYHTLGQYAKAQGLFEKSLKVRETTLGADNLLVADSVINLGWLHYSLGQYDKAEPLFRRAMKIRQAKLAPNHIDLANNVNALAAIYYALHDYPEAEKLFKQTIAIYEETLGKSHPDLATPLSNLAEVYWRQARFAEAQALYARAHKSNEATFGKEHPAVAGSLNSLAAAAHVLGNDKDAEALFQKSLQMFESTLGRDHPSVAQQGLHNSALFHAATKQADKAAKEFERARRIIRRHVARTLPVLGEKEQVTFLEKSDREQLHEALSLGLEHKDNAAIAVRSAGWLINAKAVLQQTVAERALLARASKDERLAKDIAQLADVRSQLAALTLSKAAAGRENERRQKLAALSHEEQALAREVNRAAGVSDREDPWDDPQTVRLALPADSVLVNIARFNVRDFSTQDYHKRFKSARYVAWILPPVGEQDIKVIDLGDAVAIDEAVEAVRKAMAEAQVPEKDKNILIVRGEAEAEEILNVPLRKLSALVLNPLKPHLTKTKQVFLSPDASLWLVPWAALPINGEGEKNRYAIEQWSLRFVISGRELAERQWSELGIRRGGTTTAPRIFANPNYNLGQKEALAATAEAAAKEKSKQPATETLALRSIGEMRSGSTLPQVPRLPGTAAEAKAITPKIKALAGTDPLLHDDKFALEGVFKAMRSPRVLVLSTHGFFLPDQTVELDSQSKTPGAKTAGEAGNQLENPLLRCGLMLAGCNQTKGALQGEDGVLTGMEIIGCDLRGTELVVLSACETGLGQVRNGEGVAGLRQAFQLAGAQAVLATLWQVADRDTSLLMNEFFDALAKGQTDGDALRTAQLARIKARRDRNGAAHPFFWAAFTVTGQ